MEADPIHQFHILRWIPIHIGGFDFSFTNSAAFMVVAVLLASAFLYMTTSSRGLVPGRLQSVSELAYEFIAQMLRDVTGPRGMVFFPFVFALFMFILVGNLLGMFPYFYTVTSQIVVTGALALLVFATVIVSGLRLHGLHFFSLFVPKDVPKILLPMIVMLEVLSFVSRPVSHSVRLFANLLGGHITVKVFAGFAAGMLAFGTVGVAGTIVPIIVNIAFYALELLVAFLQAYVFAILTCIYLQDALHPSH